MSKYCNSADKVKMLEPSQHFNPGFIIASKSIFWSQGSHLGQIWSQWVTFVNVNYQLLTWGDKKLQGKTAGKCPRYVGAENATFPLLFENISLLLQMWENNHCIITLTSAWWDGWVMAWLSVLCKQEEKLQLETAVADTPLRSVRFEIGVECGQDS